MNFLIDTQILIWFLEGKNLLSQSQRHIISNANNNIFVSIASLWEIAIKISIGKLTLNKPFADVINQIAIGNIEILSILLNHALQDFSLTVSSP